MHTAYRVPVPLRARSLCRHNYSGIFLIGALIRMWHARSRVRDGKMGEQTSTEESTSSVCVATVDDITSSEECEESVECEPVASILDAPKLSGNAKS